MRICTKCHLTGEFHKTSSRSDGLDLWCKGCRRVYNKGRPQSLTKANWAKSNRGKVNASTAKYRISKLGATPPWLTKEQLKEIQWFYDTAKELQWLSEEPLEVDHIVPLQGENVSGLHVPWNLQILPKSMNVRKANKL